MVFLDALFLDALFLDALFLDALFLDALFLVAGPPLFRAVVVLRLRVVLPLLLFFATERELPALLRSVLLFAPARLVDLRPADFDLELPRDDFLVVAIHALLVSR